MTALDRARDFVNGRGHDHADEIIGDLIDEMAEVLEALEDLEWRPIDTAPQDVSVLCWVKCPGGYSFWVGEQSSTYGHWIFTGYDDSGMEPTHWMPLPEPPA